MEGDRPTDTSPVTVSLPYPRNTRPCGYGRCERDQTEDQEEIPWPEGFHPSGGPCLARRIAFHHDRFPCPFVSRRSSLSETRPVLFPVEGEIIRSIIPLWQPLIVRIVLSLLYHTPIYAVPEEDFRLLDTSLGYS